jgi:hypothetical protein
MNYGSSPAGAMPLAAPKGLDVTPAALQVTPPAWRTFVVRHVPTFFELTVPKQKKS